jgi:hypothetical protein
VLYGDEQRPGLKICSVLAGMVCTYQPMQEEWLGCATGQGHYNWVDQPATFNGILKFNAHESNDDDYDWRLYRKDHAGETDADLNDDGKTGQGLHLEFDSDQTIDHFNTTWWNGFHGAVNTGNDPHAMVDGAYAIAAGLMGLDCYPHPDPIGRRCGLESHPVWVFFIHVNPDPHNDTWAFFIRNWGNEGACGWHDHPYPFRSFTVRIPWWRGATDVVLTNKPDVALVETNDADHTWGPYIDKRVNDSLRISFTIGDPSLQPFVDGELHFQWLGSPDPNAALPGPAMPYVPGRTVPRPPPARFHLDESGDEPEGLISSLVAQLPEGRQRALLASIRSAPAAVKTVPPPPLREPPPAPEPARSQMIDERLAFKETKLIRLLSRELNRDLQQELFGDRPSPRPQPEHDWKMFAIGAFTASAVALLFVLARYVGRRNRRA